MLKRLNGERKNPISLNEPFRCLNCRNSNPQADKTCRNHCRICLFSLHVDEKVPGDRQSHCHGLMKPLYINHRGNKGLQIIHICQKCGKQIPNIVAADDNLELVARLMQEQNIIPPKRKK